MDPGDASRLEGTDGAYHVERVAVPGVSVRDHRNVHASRDPRGVAGHLGHRQQAHIRPPEQRRRGTESGHVHRRETGFLDQPGGQRIECPGRHDRLPGLQQGPQPGRAARAAGETGRQRTLLTAGSAPGAPRGHGAGTGQRSLFKYRQLTPASMPTPHQAEPGLNTKRQPPPVTHQVMEVQEERTPGRRP